MRTQQSFLKHGSMHGRTSPWAFFLCSLVLAAPLLSQPMADGKDKFLGCIIKSGYPVPDNFDVYWNQVTPENAGKWGSVESSRDQYNWTELDNAYYYAKDRGLPFRFHVLVWGKQQPSWIAALDSTEQAEEVEEWIQLAGERYPDADYVEVVNEAIEWDPYDYYPSYREALGGAGTTGWDWVIWAFEKARIYFPNSKLYLNEYQIFGGNKSITTYLNIINLLKDRNLIDGICEQGHFIESLSARTIKTKIDQLAAAGLPIQITEFDLQFTDDAQQLAKYQELFPVLWEHPAVEGITFWGYMEGQIWRTNAFLVHGDGTERPAMEWLKEYVINDAVRSETAILRSFDLGQNYPNPFNPSTEIVFNLNRAAEVDLSVFNPLGERVQTLKCGFFQPGSYRTVFDASRLPSGVYTYRLESSGQCLTRKCVYIR